MNLDQRIRQGRMTRRDFLELAGLGIGALALGQCKGGSPTGPEPPEPPVPVTLQFDVYNHMLGYRTSFTKNTTSGENVNIKITECGANDVDPQRIAIREGAGGGKVGKYTAFNNTTGEANFTAPRTSTTYGVFLMNKTNGTNYQLMDHEAEPERWGVLLMPRFLTWFRKDYGVTGPDSAILEVIAQFNEALNPGWVQYGNLTRADGSGDLQIGYSNEHNYGGWHGGCDTWCAYVNPLVCDGKIPDHFLGIIHRDYRGVFIEEIFETLLCVSDIHGQGSVVRDQDRYLSLEGKELMNYVFARDKRND